MTNTTPGPWVAHIQSAGHGDGLYDSAVCICTYKNTYSNYDSPVAKQVAWTTKSFYTYGSDQYKADVEENIANAKLLAAAPDLLVALKNMVECFGSDDGVNQDVWLDQARAVIAKVGK
jgi:hypothetical protein